MPTLMTSPCYWAEERQQTCLATCNECRGEQVRKYYYEACGIDGCDYNAYGMSPRHQQSARCDNQNPKNTHCTCDTCF